MGTGCRGRRGQRSPRARALRSDIRGASCNMLPVVVSPEDDEQKTDERDEQSNGDNYQNHVTGRPRPLASGMLFRFLCAWRGETTRPTRRFLIADAVILRH